MEEFVTAHHLQGHKVALSSEQLTVTLSPTSRVSGSGTKSLVLRPSERDREREGEGERERERDKFLNHLYIARAVYLEL